MSNNVVKMYRGIAVPQKYINQHTEAIHSGCVGEVGKQRYRPFPMVEVNEVLRLADESISYLMEKQELLIGDTVFASSDEETAGFYAFREKTEQNDCCLIIEFEIPLDDVYVDTVDSVYLLAGYISPDIESFIKGVYGDVALADYYLPAVRSKALDNLSPKRFYAACELMAANDHVKRHHYHSSSIISGKHHVLFRNSFYMSNSAIIKESISVATITHKARMSPVYDCYTLRREAHNIHQ